MAQHKRHHYVPRCYLRAFSFSACGRAINLYNLAAGKAIKSAPVKGQCARDYFYGDPTDLRLEKALQLIEGAYARSIRKIEAQVNTIDHLEIATLREFTFLQWLRTDIALKRMRLFYDDFEAVAYERFPDAPPQQNISDRKLVLLAMRQYINLRRYLQDLTGVIIANRARDDFITSDDPCFFTNRFYLQKIRRMSPSFGLASSGALFFLPLTPRYQLMCYDGNVYHVPEKQGHYVTIDRPADVRALNELQYLKAAENLYFSNWNDRTRIESEYPIASRYRMEAWHEIDVFVRDRFTETGEYYRRASEEERLSAPATLQVASSRYAKPLHWISQLRYRLSPKVYYNGSGAGYVRKPEWLTREP